MKKLKIVMVVLFYLIGVILVIIANRNLSKSVPNLESQLAENQKKIDIDYLTDLQLKNEIDFVAQDKSMLAEMNQLGFNASSESYYGLHVRLYALYIQMLGNIEVLESGKKPSDEQMAAWSSMSREELETELDQGITDITNGTRAVNNFYSGRTNLTTKKNDLMSSSLLLQALGLIFTQVGTALAFLFREQNTQNMQKG